MRRPARQALFSPGPARRRGRGIRHGGADHASADLGVWDVARAVLAWEETCHAAEAVAQAAEKLSVTTYTYDNTTKPVTALTSQQMQYAMSSIYGEMPWLNVGSGTGLFGGNFGVTLSGIAFNAPCLANPQNTCATQVPYVLWSSSLSEVYPKSLQLTQQERACGNVKNYGPQFPNDNTQLTYMIDPSASQNGAQNMILIPQVVADVHYTFTPSFPLLANFTYTFWASATFPAPLGGDDQAIIYDNLHSAQPNNVLPCVPPPGVPQWGAYNG